MLENIYLCGINNNTFVHLHVQPLVVICLKISIFVVSTTTAEPWGKPLASCDLLENIYLCGINNNWFLWRHQADMLWFAWKYLSLWYQQQLWEFIKDPKACCDLLENIYLCGINNNMYICKGILFIVVICLKISIFVVSTTTFIFKY